LIVSAVLCALWMANAIPACTRDPEPAYVMSDAVGGKVIKIGRGVLDTALSSDCDLIESVRLHADSPVRPGDFLMLSRDGLTEWIALGHSVSGSRQAPGERWIFGTFFSVTRNVSGTACRAWPAGTEFFNTGQAAEGIVDRYVQ
jgi:hypothetical protein